MKHVRIPDFSQPVPARPASGLLEHNSDPNSLTCKDKTASRFDGARRRVPTDGRYLNLPNEPVPGGIEAWEAVVPVRPDTAHSRSLRFLDTVARHGPRS